MYTHVHWHMRRVRNPRPWLYIYMQRAIAIRVVFRALACSCQLYIYGLQDMMCESVVQDCPGPYPSDALDDVNAHGAPPLRGDPLQVVHKVQRKVQPANGVALNYC